MTTAVLELNVSGMICRACEDAIADALLHTRGVISAQAHYWRSRVTITYDPDVVTEGTLRQVLTNTGYPPSAPQTAPTAVYDTTRPPLYAAEAMSPRLLRPVTPRASVVCASRMPPHMPMQCVLVSRPTRNTRPSETFSASAGTFTSMSSFGSPQ